MRIIGFIFVVIANLCLNSAISQATASIIIDRNAIGNVIDSNFVGFSFNPAYINMYFGTNYNGANNRQITSNLFQNFQPFQHPAIRFIGANNSYWKGSGIFATPPSVWNVNSAVYNCTYCPSTSPTFGTAIDLSDLNNVNGFVNNLSYKPLLYWGINLAVIDTARIANFCQNIKASFNTNCYLKYELGNEPDAYISNGRRLAGYSLFHYLLDFNFVAHRIKNYGTLVGPVLAKADPTNVNGWADSLGYYIANTNNVLSAISYHTYPLGQAAQGNASYFLQKYLTNNVTTDEVSNPTTGLLPSIQLSNLNGLDFRLAECNSIANGGKQGASNVLGSALWGIDMMFELAKVSASGINFSTEGGSTVYYSPFTYSSAQLTGTDKVLVNPLYYGALLFARACQKKPHFIDANIVNTSNNPNLKIWGLEETNTMIRLVILNRGNSISDISNTTCTINLANNTAIGTAYSLVGSTLPHLQATNVSLAGQIASTQTGLMSGSLTSTSITPLNGDYSLSIPAGTAVLIEIPISSTALPANLLDFTLNYDEQRNSVECAWKVIEEHQVSHYEVQRGNEASYFETIGELPAGNKNEYHFLDTTCKANISYYRIKIVDIDLNSYYSSVISIKTNKQAQLPHFYLNQNEIIFENIDGSQIHHFIIYDKNGREIANQEIQQGNTEFRYHINHLAKGVYLIHLFNDYQAITRKILVM